MSVHTSTHFCGMVDEVRVVARTDEEFPGTVYIRLSAADGLQHTLTISDSAERIISLLDRIRDAIAPLAASAEVGS